MKVTSFDLQNSSKVVVTFTPLQNRLKDGFGFGGEFILKNGYSLLSIKYTIDDWYKSVTEDDIELIRNFIKKYEIKIGYGSSMGGFASLFFSKKLEFNKVIAISPQYDISVDWDSRWRHLSNQSIGQVIDKGCISENCSYVIIYDNKNMDSRHVENIVSTNPLLFQLIPISRSGHPSTTFLNEINCLSRLIRSVLDDVHFDKTIFRDLVRKSPSALYELSIQLFVRRKFFKSLEFVNWAILIAENDNSTYYYHRSLIYKRLNLVRSACESAKLAAKFRPNDQGILDNYKSLCNLLKFEASF